MNRYRTLSICAAVGLAIQISAPAGFGNVSANRYQPIAVKNIFRLKALPKVENKKAEPLPTITLQGITCFTWRKQVLFRINAANHPGQPSKEIAVALNEGERWGEIEVVEINERSATVTFRNHGQIQTLCLKGR